MNNKKITKIAIFSALSIIFGYIETLFPLPIPVYGAKIGISNIAILTVLYLISAPVSWGIMLIKTFLSSLLFSGFSAFLYSVSGGFFSLLIMSILKKTKLFSVVGISIAGGVFHNIGQLIVAAIFLKNLNIFYYLPILIVIGLISGGIIGIISNIIIKRLS